MEKEDLEDMDMSKLIPVFGFLDYDHSNAGIKMQHFSTECFSSSQKVSLGILKEEFKLLVVENLEFRNFGVQVYFLMIFLTILAVMDQEQK